MATLRKHAYDALLGGRGSAGNALLVLVLGSVGLESDYVDADLGETGLRQVRPARALSDHPE